MSAVWATHQTSGQTNVWLSYLKIKKRSFRAPIKTKSQLKKANARAMRLIWLYNDYRN